MTEWDGHERRKPQPDGKEGRRPSDQHCGQHYVLWDKHDEDKNSYRGLTCGKITKIEADINSEVGKLEKVDAAISTKIEEMNKIVVGKFWFRVAIGSMFAALIYIAGQNRLSNNDQIYALRDISKNQKEISATVNNIENKQIEMVGQMRIFEFEIKELTKRQDILRDINIKQREDGRDGRDGKVGRDWRDAPK